MDRPQNKPRRAIIISKTIKVSFLVFALIIAYLFALNGRYIKVSADEYFLERVSYEDGYYYQVHLSGCDEYKTRIHRSSPIIGFMRMKDEAYCPFCFDEEDIDMFNSISRRNYLKAEKATVDISEIVRASKVYDPNPGTCSPEFYYNPATKEFIER